MSGLVHGPWFVSEPPQATSHYTVHTDGSITDNIDDVMIVPPLAADVRETGE